MRYVTPFICGSVVLAIVGLWQVGVHAQAGAIPALEIIDMDTTQFPTIQLSVVGDNLPGDVGALPLKLFEGDQAQVIITDTVEQRGLQVAMVVDPRDLLALGRSGYTHRAEVIGATLDLINRQAITRSVDLLAAYSTRADGGLQTIQEWTSEPNLIFNSLVQNKIEDPAAGKQPGDLLLEALDAFLTPRPPEPLARSLILFSSGATPFDIDAAVAKANELKIRIHTIELVSPGQATPAADTLQQLARRTDGRYIFFASKQDLTPLAVSLAGLRRQRILTYRTGSTSLAPIKVRLALPDGSNTEAIFAPANQAYAANSAETPDVSQVSTPPAPAARPNSVSALGTPAGSDMPAPQAGFGLPLVASLLALATLILVAVYWVYRQARVRRAGQPQANRLNRTMDAKDSRLFALSQPDEDLKPLPKHKGNSNRFELTADQEMQAQAAASWQSPLPEPGRDSEGDPNWDSHGSEQDDEATSVPWPGLDDDDATYRLTEAVQQPIIGYFIRVTSDPNLPSELPIYALSPTRGELRQIHIGRHSKNNTVVINDKNISREHAVIIQKEGRLYLRDNASTAGTYLNWRRLKPGEELLLRHNDIVSFGEIVYEFHAKGEDEATVVGE